MLKRSRHYFSNEKYQKMIKNFSYLSLINIVNKMLPLIVVPYVVRTIGVEKYGVVTFALAVVSYFILITQYSFSLTAVKHISKNRDDKKCINKYFWVVLFTKLLLALICFVLFSLMIVSVDRFFSEWKVFFLTFIIVIADVLMPLWFFRGIEEMKYIAIFNILAKLIYTIGVFLFIHRPEDYFLIPLLNSVSLLLISLYALYFAVKEFDIQFVVPAKEDILHELKEGKDIFLSNISVSFYSTINTVLLGFLSTYTVVGIYSLAFSIFSAYNSVIKTYTAVVYPHLARYIDNIKLLYTQGRKFFKFYLLILFVASLILFIFSDLIITLLFGSGHEESIYILKILSIALLFDPLGAFFTAYMSLKSQYKIIRSITFKTMITNLVLVIPVIQIFDAKGVAYLLLILAIIQVSLNIYYNQEILNRGKVK